MRSGILISIDKTIINSINNGKSLLDISKELKNRSSNIFISVRDEYNSIDELLLTDSDKLLESSAKVKYVFEYIYYCKKRSNDIEWLHKYRNRFKKISNLKLLSLIQLKDKLLNEA
jgi:N12 class adenine-specific DNA methylase